MISIPGKEDWQVGEDTVTVGCLYNVDYHLMDSPEELVLSVAFVMSTQ